MFCYKCGQKLPDNANFCSKCGAETMVPHEQQRVVEAPQPQKKEIFSPDKADFESYEDRITRDILSNVADWLEQGKMTSAESNYVADIMDDILQSMGEITNKADLLSRMRVAALYSPVLKECYEKHKNDKLGEEETPRGRLLSEALLLEAIAKHGYVTLDIVIQGCKLDMKLFELGRQLGVLPVFPPAEESRLRGICNLFYNTLDAITRVEKRWESDREKRFRNQKLVVSDYKVIAEEGVWGLFKHAGIDIENINPLSLLTYPPLQSFFKAEVLKRLFAALLADGEQPKAYREAYASLRNKYYPSNNSSERVDTILGLAAAQHR